MRGVTRGEGEAEREREVEWGGDPRRRVLGNVAEIQIFLRITKINLWRY